MLSSLPLPDPDGTSSKHERGTVLIVGGTVQTPGSLRLAGLAALRVGAGRLRLATDPAVCTTLAVAVPEARVAPFDEIGELARRADVVLCGVGTRGPDVAAVALERAVASLGADAALVVDAGGLDALAENAGLVDDIAPRCVLTPNPTELAKLLGRDEHAVVEDPDGAVCDAVARLGVVVSLRGTQARTAAPGSEIIVDERGNAGLGTSGSGDVAVGAIAGLLARGVPPLAAAAWGNHLHRVAGERCAETVGPVGYLASDLLVELPRALRDLTG